MRRPWSLTTFVAACAAAGALMAQPPQMRYPITSYPTTGSGLAPTPSQTYNGPSYLDAQPPAPPAEASPMKEPAPMPKPAPMQGHADMSGVPMGKGYAPCTSSDEFLRACEFWYGRAGANYMNRDEGNELWMSFDTNNSANQFLGSRQAAAGWGWGADVLLGRTFCNGAYAIEVGYWGVDPSAGSIDQLDPDGTTGTASDLDTTYSFDSLEYNGTAVADFFANAEIHRLVRSYEAHNVELNFAGSPIGTAGCCGDHAWSVRWLAGIRYLKFNDGFDYMTDDADTVFNGNVNEVVYTIDVDNNFIGAQIGSGLTYRYSQAFSAYANAKVGLYGAHISHHSVISGSAGDAVVNNAGSPYNGQAFNVRSSETDVAIIGEIDLGMRYAFTRHWSAHMGYRAVGISGVALATNQIPQYFADIGGVANIDTNGSVILHGGYFGFQFVY